LEGIAVGTTSETERQTTLRVLADLEQRLIQGVPSKG
jgi:hypothetical protein